MNWHRSPTGGSRSVVGLLAAMLAAQAMLFVWVVAQSGRTLPGNRPPGSRKIAGCGDALERDPELDLGHYLNEQYAQYTHPFFVMLADNRVIAIGDAPIDSWVQATRALLRRRLAGHGDPHSPDVRGRDHQARPGRANVVSPLERDDPEAAVLGFQPMAFVVNGRVAGMVVVPPRASFAFLLTRFAPMLSLVAAAVLIVGSVFTSVLIFGPPRRRLRGLELAARRVGAGDLSVRAPETGGDEIAAVATAFNAMAVDLSARPWRSRPRTARDGSCWRERLARAQHADHRDARAWKRSRCRISPWTRTCETCRSSGTKRPASNGWSATCSNWRDSRAARQR